MTPLVDVPDLLALEVFQQVVFEPLAVEGASGDRLEVRRLDAVGQRLLRLFAFDEMAGVGSPFLALRHKCDDVGLTGSQIASLHLRVDHRGSQQSAHGADLGLRPRQPRLRDRLLAATGSKHPALTQVRLVLTKADGHVPGPGDHGVGLGRRAVDVFDGRAVFLGVIRPFLLGWLLARIRTVTAAGESGERRQRNRRCDEEQPD